MRETGLQDAGVQMGEQLGVVQAGVGDAVAVAVGDTGDQAVGAEPA
jgi:hypothetical protein